MTREKAQVRRNLVEDGIRFSETVCEQIPKTLAGLADQGYEDIVRGT